MCFNLKKRANEILQYNIINVHLKAAINSNAENKHLRTDAKTSTLTLTNFTLENVISQFYLYILF